LDSRRQFVFRRGLLDEALIARLKELTTELGPRLNAYLKSIGAKKSK